MKTTILKETGMDPQRNMKQIHIFNVGYCVVILFLLGPFTTSSLGSLNTPPTFQPKESSPHCTAEVTDLAISPSNMTSLTFNLAFLASISNNGGDKLIGGAFYYAIEVLEKEAMEKSIPITFTKIIPDTRNEENRAMRIMGDLYCGRNISAFIGPEGHCRSAGMMATAFNIPFMTYGCQDNHNETNQHGMINTDPSIAYVSKFITAILQHFQWSSFWLVTGTDLHWQYTAKQLIRNAESRNITLNGKTSLRANDAFSPYIYKSYPYAEVIESTRDYTRVYVFLGCYECLIAFLRQMQTDGLTQTGRYVVVAADNKDIPDHQEFYLLTDELKKNTLSPEDKERKLQAFRNVLMVETKNQNNDMDEFEREVLARSFRPPFNYPKLPPIVKSVPEMGKKVYHLYDATIIIGLSVMSLMGTVGADPTNASQVVHHIKGRQHCSKLGYNITIHQNGETEDSYEVRGHTFIHSKLQNVFDVVGSFHLEKGNLVYLEQVSMWGQEGVPVSDPKCGFNGEKCEDTSQMPDWGIAILVIVVFLIGVILILVFRHCAYEKKLDRLLWKIQLGEIVDLDDQFYDTATPRPKKKESIINPSSPLLLHDSPDTFGVSDQKTVAFQVQPRIGEYKGCTVFVKQLARKHLELTRNLKRDFQLRKELTHDNINRFIGASIDPPNVSIVTQFCTRKSLQDILHNQAMPSREMFIPSVVQDLINGISFIHESDFGFHGNLKSSNCLVDRRWTVKITDFGFSAMGLPPPARGDDDTAYEKLLWTAPEFLQRRFNSSSSYISLNNSSSLSQSVRPSKTFNSLLQHPHSYNNDSNKSAIYIKAQQKGDAYSFAIILYELYGQAGPWGNPLMSAKEIIGKLLNPPISEMFRPDTSRLHCDRDIINLMHSCWSEDADSRPDFKHTIRNKFKTKQQGCLVELYADNLEMLVAKRTEELRKEKIMTVNLLHRMLPSSVADRLMRGNPVHPEQFECVTIYFSDIVGFTELSAESDPIEVVNLLNDLYTLFDSVIHKFLVYKVETIGDAYMVVSGLPNSIGDLHAGEIASMSLLFQQKLIEKRFTVRGQTDYMLKIRIGIHSGPCAAGVVGLKMPRYCLFGDTVNTANRMESTGEALKIHCSAQCKAILDKLGGYRLEKRGHTEVKGKGQLLTYFLIGEDDNLRKKRLASMKPDGRCVSLSNLDYSGTPLNRRSAPPISCIPPLSPNQNGIRTSSISLPHSSASFHSMKNNYVPAILNTSIDSTSSASFYPNDSIDYETHAIADFRSSTLPRPSVALRQNSIGGCGGKNMSPIAEDPWSPSALVLNEKGFKFHDNGIGVSDTDSECDTLLNQVPSMGVKRNNSLQRQNSSEHSPVPSSLMRNSTNTPETVL